MSKRKPFIIGTRWIWYAHGDAADEGSVELRGLASERERISINRADLVRAIFAMATFYSGVDRAADKDDKEVRRRAEAVATRAHRWLEPPPR
jgi:hypothetical protein